LSIEFEFPSNWAKQLFDKVESTMATQLLEQASSLGRGLNDYLKERAETSKDLAQKLYNEKYIQTIDESELKNNRKIAVGIDSSRRQPIRVLNNYFCPLTTAIVFFINNQGNNFVEYDPFSPFLFYEDSNKPQDLIMKEIEKEMYRLEVEAIIKSASIIYEKNIPSEKMVFFCDGPLIDPPNKILSQKYVKTRSQGINAHISNSELVLGCVKTLEGSQLISSITEFDEDLGKIAEGFGSDAQFVPCVLGMASKMTEKILYTNPIELIEPKKVIEKYAQNNLTKIYRMYFTPSPRSNILCVEYVAENYDKAKLKTLDILSASNSWTFPGINNPLPVIAAHRRCNIGQGAAEHLYRELLTRAFSSEEAAELMKSLLRGEM